MVLNAIEHIPIEHVSCNQSSLFASILSPAAPEFALSVPHPPPILHLLADITLLPSSLPPPQKPPTKTITPNMSSTNAIISICVLAANPFASLGVLRLA
ncbi:hypothetical protein Moror_2343 [Moniliophthora roreri MCA 2997]|uniref:Uncharacterized protein n=1 Tax=Moniliophthora roreri (strain MCA 2997) TaxID=1381753 RepID=V2WZB1_MONRO|nr:hypothetical protein Moror_2343 [Moniliophthora roreri MCA 2997]